MEIQIQKGLPPEAAFIRTEVFIHEQGFCGEFDEIDSRALHFVLYERGQAAATARLFSQNGEWIIGRVAVLKSFRSRGLGSAIMKRIITFAQEQGIESLILHAQCAAVPFYESLGFHCFGNSGEEEGVPHRFMRLTL